MFGSSGEFGQFSNCAASENSGRLSVARDGGGGKDPTICFVNLHGHRYPSDMPLEFEAELVISADFIGRLCRLEATTNCRAVYPRQRNSNGPMLAKRWQEDVPLPLIAQPKFNGIRMVASRAGLRSRTGAPLGALPHIDAALAPIFRRHPELELDGEAYAHGEPLTVIQGAVMRQQPSDESLRIRFHVFDYVSAEAFADRDANLRRILPHDCPQLSLAPSVTCCSRRDVDNHFSQMLGEGYEGQMLRDPVAPYTRGRSNALLKRKPQADSDDVLFSMVSSFGMNTTDVRGSIVRPAPTPALSDLPCITHLQHGPAGVRRRPSPQA